MRVNRHHWRLLLFGGAVAFFIFSLLNGAPRGSAKGVEAAAVIPPAPRVPVQERRRANANQATRQYLADPANRGRPIDALVSFRRGLPLTAALGELKGLAPGSTTVVVTLALHDATGQRHVIGVRILPGEDPAEKVSRIVRGSVEQTRTKASATLNCKGQPDERCQRAAEKDKAGLVAMTQLDPNQALVYGVVVNDSATTIERLLAADVQTVAFVEIVRGSPFNAPIWPVEEGGN